MRRSRRLLKTRFNTNEILTSLMLVYVAQLFLDWLVRGPWRDPEGYNFPQTRRCSRDPPCCRRLCRTSGRANWGIVFALVAAVLVWFLMSRTLKGFEVRVLGSSPRAGRFAGFWPRTAWCSSPSCSPARWPALPASPKSPAPSASCSRSISPGYGFTAIIVAFLGRLNPLGIIAAGPGAGADLSRRRGGADRARHLRQGGARLPGHAAVLRARLRHADPLPHPHRPASAAPRPMRTEAR